MGAAIVAVGANTGQMVLPSTCPQHPVETMARLSLGFEENSPVVEILEKEDADLGAMRLKIAEIYNGFSDCNEPY